MNGFYLWLYPQEHLSVKDLRWFPGGSVGKEPACNVGDLGSIPGLGRSPGEGNSYPLQYSGLKNSMNCIVHRVAKSQTQLATELDRTHCEHYFVILNVLCKEALLLYDIPSNGYAIISNCYLHFANARFFIISLFLKYAEMNILFHRSLT